MKYIARILSAILICGSHISLSAQKVSVETIKSDPLYVWGQGFGSSFTEADQNALSNLTSKIATNVSSSFTQNTSFVNSNNGTNEYSATEMIVNSYAQSTLTNTNSIIVREQPDFEIIRYISKAELEKVFKQRKEKVFDLIRAAGNAESKNKIDVALRNYYWAMTLLKSLQYPNAVRYEDKEDGALLNTWIPQQIEEILNNLTVTQTSQQGDEITLGFKYKDIPVRSLEFSFYNGNGWTPLYAAKDGEAIIELRPGVDPKSLRVRYEYEFLGESQIDPEIQSVLKIFKNNYFKNSEIVVGTGKQKGQKGSKANKAEVAQNLESLMIKSDTPYEKILDRVRSAVEHQNYESVRDLFTADGWDMMSQLLKYGKARLVGKQEKLAFYNLDGGRTLCRSMKMSFSFPNNHKTFTEDVTFTFNADKKIESIAFGLGDEARHDIFEKGKDVWDDRSKLIIANFLENYKTAFALKRIDYLESIFDDNAIIITGSVTKKLNQQNIGDLKGFVVEDAVKYNRYTKKEYIQKLRSIMNRNEFVNIRFADNDIVKMGKGGEVYGIQIHQDYYSQYYGDTGYLFLIVDVNNPDAPIIQVRTWQPERDPNINNRLPRNHPDYGIYGPGLF